MTISVSEYQGRFVPTKTIELEKEVEFEIRRLSPLDMWDKDPKTQTTADFIKNVALKGTINPPLSDSKEDGKIDIRDLPAGHLNTLVSEILQFSGYTTPEGGKADFLSQEGKG